MLCLLLFKVTRGVLAVCVFILLMSFSTILQCRSVRLRVFGHAGEHDGRTACLGPGVDMTSEDLYVSCEGGCF